MRQIKTFSDERLNYYCAYCGREPDTRDHVPSKILLDKPYPKNLPVVPACEKCNNGFSLDEEYLGCLIECVLNGTTNPKKLQRKNISKILTKKKRLKERLEKAKKVINGNIFFDAEVDRIKNVVTKLAQGHYRFENSESQFSKPDMLWFQSLETMTNEEFQDFFTPHIQNKAPEVGSRALQELMFSTSSVPMNKWIEVQPHNYKYSVLYLNNAYVVKIVIWDYLACEAVWSET